MKKLYYFYLGIFLLTACKSRDNISYMKNVDHVIETQISAQAISTTIQPGDQLVIVVSAKDDDVVKPFNKNYSSSEITQFSEASLNMPTQGQNKSVTAPSYTVDSNFYLDFPGIGQIYTKGLTLEGLREELRLKISKYVKNPSVSVKNINFKITVLGEVNKPGHFVVPDGQPTTLLSALGMAGDLTIYGERDNILLVRNIDGEVHKQYLDINSGDFLKSPFYYVKQNDIIYVTSNKVKRNSSMFGPQVGVWISVASIVVTILALVIKK